MIKALINKKVTATMALMMVVALTLATSAFADPLTEPVIPTSDAVFQKMLDVFGKAGTIGLLIIGGAVALGAVMILGAWAWGAFKKWLNKSK
ncbi:MAG: hypothetical protein K6T85_00780 [Gorillibacterium sp.]|nr:hypothetical protein [Gorillibacterium sp.]